MSTLPKSSFNGHFYFANCGAKYYSVLSIPFGSSRVSVKSKPSFQKFIKLILLQFFIFFGNAKADVGCYVNGANIHTSPDGTFLNENAFTAVPRYSFNPKIHRQTWSGDECGIPSSVVDKYPKAAGTPNNTDSRCVINASTYGMLINYNPSDSNCPVMQVPLDDYIPILILAFGLGSLFFFRKLELK